MHSLLIQNIYSNFSERGEDKTVIDGCKVIGNLQCAFLLMKVRVCMNDYICK